MPDIFFFSTIELLIAKHCFRVCADTLLLLAGPNFWSSFRQHKLFLRSCRKKKIVHLSPRSFRALETFFFKKEKDPEGGQRHKTNEETIETTGYLRNVQKHQSRLLESKP